MASRPALQSQSLLIGNKIWRFKKKLFTFLKLQVISDYSGKDADSCPNTSTSTTTGPITQNNNTNTNNTEENHKGMFFDCLQTIYTLSVSEKEDTSVDVAMYIIVPILALVLIGIFTFFCIRR